MKLLITGFEPFGSSTINPSQEIVAALAEKEIEGVEIITAVLPVERFAGPDTLIRTYISAHPDAVLLLGEASHAAAIRVERVAVNVLDFAISDNGGHLITDKPIITDGPPAYFSTLPTREMVSALKENELPAQLSYSAGTFLCNQVMYEMLHYLQKNHLNLPAGFVHVPQLPAQVTGASSPRPSMSLETMLKGILVMIQTIQTHLASQNSTSTKI